METELKKLIAQGLSIGKIAKELNRPKSSVRNWLVKFKLKTIVIKTEDKKCPKCNTTKHLSEFYNRRNKAGNSPYCKVCTGKQTLDRIRLFKVKCVEYKGGKCVSCGYNKYQGALEFHHLDPNEKDFNLSDIRTNSFDDTIKKELDKCALLCSNCHREIHDGITVL